MDLVIAIIAVVLGMVASAAITWMVASRRHTGFVREVNDLVKNEERLNETIANLNSDIESRENSIESLDQQKRETENQLNLAHIEAARVIEGKDGLDRQLAELKNEHEQLQEDFKNLQDRKSEYKTAYEKLKTANSEKVKNHEDRLNDLKDAETRLTTEFSNLANKIFEAKEKSLREKNQVSLEGILKPLKDKIEAHQKRMNEINSEFNKENSKLSAELKTVKDVGLQMADDAKNLTTALKGDSQKRGAWGEAMLERTLQMSGLVEGEHYSKQDSHGNELGERKITDFIVRLPDRKCIVIDSKISLVDYDRAVSAETDEEYAKAIKAHTASVKKHIDDLKRKDYSSISKFESPNFVVMFMPIEPAFIEAMKYDRGLFEYGVRHNVIITSHTTLTPILRTIQNLWILEQQNREAKEIGNAALDIWNSVCAVTKQVQELGKSFGTCGKKYNDLVTKLVGNQGLTRKIEKFERMSTNASKELVTDIEPVVVGGEDPRLRLEEKGIDQPVEIPENITP